MNDRAVALLEQYDIEVQRVRKGRGGIICETPTGMVILKEYAGTEAKLQLQDRILKQIEGRNLVKTDMILPTKEGALQVKDKDGITYILKTYLEGRECNIGERDECLLAMSLLGKLHNSMKDLEAEAEPLDNVLSEYEKHNKELIHISNFLRKKKQKQPFERELYGVLDTYTRQAQEITEGWRRYVQDLGLTEPTNTYYHGSYQYHNIICFDKEWYITNFEKCRQGSQVRDIFLMLRKLLEKNDWQPEFGKELLQAYIQERPLNAQESIELYYRLAYPEKFWKIVNFYYNAPKAWIPQRNMEKLQKLLEQEENRQRFLSELVEGIYFEKR